MFYKHSFKISTKNILALQNIKINYKTRNLIALLKYFYFLMLKQARNHIDYLKNKLFKQHIEKNDFTAS